MENDCIIRQKVKVGDKARIVNPGTSADYINYHNVIGIIEAIWGGVSSELVRIRYEDHKRIECYKWRVQKCSDG